MASARHTSEDREMNVPLGLVGRPRHPLAGLVTASGAATTAGHRRATNEDAHMCGPRWYVVADGMGGHRNGHLASHTTVDVFGRSIDDAPRTRFTVADVDELVQRAHRTVIDAAASSGALGMGATLVGAGAVMHGGRPAIAVFHLGDARCYRLAGGQLTLLTRDHSHVRELIDCGRLDPSAADAHPLRNVVTRAVGVELADGPDIQLVDGPSRLLLCSDGISGELDARTIGRVLVGVADAQGAADRLVELVLDGEARDNATAVVLDVAAAPSIDASARSA